MTASLVDICLVQIFVLTAKFGQKTKKYVPIKNCFEIQDVKFLEPVGLWCF